MPLIGKVGRKSPRARLGMSIVYGLLILGAVTTVYPFIMMLSISFKGPTDQNDTYIIPKYWSDSAELIAKDKSDKYAGNMEQMASYAIGDTASAEEVDEYRDFLMDLPPTHWQAGYRLPVNHVAGKLRLKWQVHLKEKYGSVEKLNETYLEINPAFEQLEPPSEKLDHQKWQPREGQKWEDWIEFKNTLPPNFRIPVRGEWMQQQYLRSKYINQIDSVPDEIRQGAETFSDIRLISEGPFYDEFMAAAVPPAFGGVLIEETWAARSDAPMPILAEEADFVTSNSKSIKSEFIARSYKWVIGYILINGRSLTNTFIFCALAIGLQLIINPLAAYALSRFPIKLTAQILIFLLATMAFPAEVAMIPSFLLLKNLGLLNTFAALVLPTAANGFMIFLLKGFFDSLPREIFESGQIDGAKEHTMMVKLALPLSKPVLGYMALLAFMGAYGSFMYAFLVAQDRDMWTLMVFIYQLQGFAPKHTIMAAVTLAAIPTLFVFLIAQRVIMRGIVLPSER